LKIQNNFDSSGLERETAKGNAVLADIRGAIQNQKSTHVLSDGRVMVTSPGTTTIIE